MAEGNGLLNRHRAKSLVAGSNPALSANRARDERDEREKRDAFDLDVEKYMPTHLTGPATR